MTTHILIVEDNPTNMRLVADVLELEGYEVTKAMDAEQALAALGKIHPDMILMDIAMPGMDGLTLTRKLKADERYRAIPVVALTASAMKGDDQKALVAGCQGYITKPIDTRKFASQVRTYLSQGLQQSSDAQKDELQRILIVDDTSANRRLLRAGLEAEGCTVLEVSNGTEALHALSRNCVDAVISDILMPVMDGFRLCHEIRKSPVHANLPFVLYTSTYDSAGDRELAETVGADGYVLKPAPISLLLQTLRIAQLKAGVEPRPRVPLVQESVVLEQYNAALVRKLEERNTQLQITLADLQVAHEKILEFNRFLEARVAQRTIELDTANKELESFSYSVAHDLRAPLRHINGFADLLQETAGERLDEESRTYLGKIMDAASRMGQLITDLLTFSRTARTELKISEIDLEEVLTKALQAIQADIEGRNIRWLRQRLPRARGDAALLSQVLVNLLSNAVKYTRPREQAVIEVGLRPGRAREVVIFVRDNGVGFDMQHAGKLFGVFQRLHSGSQFEGTGVGLANAQRILARHGGKIWAEAALDQGATFLFSLPSDGVA